MLAKGFLLRIAADSHHPGAPARSFHRPRYAKAGHGAFTKALLDALAAANREPRRLTATDLERYLYETVSDMTGQAQTPTVAKAGLPDFILVPGSR